MAAVAIWTATALATTSQAADWLIHPPAAVTELQTTAHGLTLTNGLVEREFLIRGGAFCTIDLRGVPGYTHRTFLRAISPEANMSLLVRSGPHAGQRGVFAVGGCEGTPRLPGTQYTQAAFLNPSWLANLTANDSAFQYMGHETSEPVELFAWQPGRFGAPSVPWPPRGLRLTVYFGPPPGVLSPFRSVRAAVHYEMYDGLPLIRKWVELWRLGGGRWDSSPEHGHSSRQGSRASAGSPMREGRRGPHLDLQTEARPGTADGKGSGVSGDETASPPQSEAEFRHSAGAELRATPEPGEVEVGAEIESLHYEMLRAPNLAPGVGAGEVEVGVEIESLHYEMLRAPNLAPGVGAGEVEVGVEIESLEYEMLRAPNLAPEHMTVITQHANNPLPWDDQVAPILGVPGTREQQFWFSDDDYDAPNDKELHARWTFYTRLSVGYTDSAVYGGPTGPGAVLIPGGEAFESLSVRLVLHDSMDIERKGLALRECYSKLTPSLSESPLMFMSNDITGFNPNASGTQQNLSAPLRLAIDQAAETGHELVIVGFGAEGWCGLCEKQRDDPAFRSWFKAHVAYGRARNVSLSGYTLMQHNGWGMGPIPTPAQTLNRDGTRGPTACFATDWHAQYRQGLLDFVSAVGMAGLETDGQYEAIACADETHGHNGLRGGWSNGLQATLDFNVQLKRLGIYQTGADSYIWSGANHWNHADNDMMGSLPLWEKHALGRLYTYDSTFTRPPASGSIPTGRMVEDTADHRLGTWPPAGIPPGPTTGPPAGIPPGPTTGPTAGIPPGPTSSSPLAGSGCGPTIHRLHCLDFLLAGYFVYGTPPYQHARSLWPADDPHAAGIARLLRKWSSFFVAYRRPRPSGAAGLFLSRLLHLRRPSLRGLEAVALVTPDASDPSRALLGVLNPTSDHISELVQLPLYYTGLPPGTAVVVSELSLRPRGFELEDLPLLAPASHEAHEPPPPLYTRHVLGEPGGGFTDVTLRVRIPPVGYAIYEVTVPSDAVARKMQRGRAEGGAAEEHELPVAGRKAPGIVGVEVVVQ